MNAKQILLSAITCLSVFAAQAQMTKLPPQGVVNNIAPANILISLDTSGSMSGQNMDNAVTAIRSIVTKFGGVARFGLSRWNSGSSYDDFNSPIIPIDPNSQNSNNAIIADANYYLQTPRKAKTFWYAGSTHAADRGMGYPLKYFTTGAGRGLVGGNCQKTIIILISDGAWPSADPAKAATTATLLRTNYGVTTVVLGIDAVYAPGSPRWNSYNIVSSAGGGGTPLFSGNAAQMETELTAKLSTVLAESFTATAPAVMSSVSAGSLIFQPTFEYRAKGQWKGYLKAYNLDTVANDVALKWEFGANLANVEPEQRNLWTVAPNLPTPAQSLYKNFTVGNVTWLRGALSSFWNSSLYDTDANTLIRFVQGYDVYDDDQNLVKGYPNRRWALGDVFHAKPVYVGPPQKIVTDDPSRVGVIGHFESLAPNAYNNFVTTWQNRTPVLLAASNSGVLHAINPSNGTELWGFIPPPVLDKLIYMSPTSATDPSQARYLIDGDITVRDVYVNNQWRTYAALTYGFGARAFTVLDITNTTAPKHVVSVENVMEGGVWTVKMWDENGSKSSPNGGLAAFSPYKQLGYTVAAPIFSFAKNINGQYAPVMILSAGFSSPTALVAGATGNVKPDTGNVVLVVNLDGATVDPSGTNATRVGAVVRSIDAHNPVGAYAGCPGPSCNVPMNQLLTDVEVIEGGRTSRMQSRFGAELFIPNYNGSLQAVDLSGTAPVTTNLNVNASPVATFSPGNSVTNMNDRMITVPISISSLTYTKTPGQLNVAFGTGDMTNLNLAGKIPDVDNKVYSFQGPESTFFANASYATTDLVDVSMGASACPMPLGKKGWMLSLNSQSAITETGASVNTLYGKVASKVVQYGGATIVTVYKPRTDGQCSIGDSALFLRDSVCGTNKQSQAFSNAMIGGATVIGDTVVIGISGASGRKSLDTTTGNRFTKVDNLIIGKGNFDFSSSGIGSVNIYNKQQVR